MFLESNKGPGPKYDMYRWAGGGAPGHIPSKQLVTTLPGPQGAEGRTGVMSGPALPMLGEKEGCSGTPAREALPGILWSTGPLGLDRGSHSGHTCPACSFGIVIWEMLAQKKPYPDSRRHWHRQMGNWKGL